MSVLRADRHPRGHIAHCNGKIELVRARVEQCVESPGNAVKMATLMEANCREEVSRKAHKLLIFQRDVKDRVRMHERARQRRVAGSCSEAVQFEEKMVKKALTLKTKGEQPQCLRLSEVVPDVEDVRVIGTPQSEGQPSASQLARKTLLAQSNTKGAPHKVIQNLPKPIALTREYRIAEPTTSQVAGHKPRAKSSLKHKQKTALNRFTPSGRLEHDQKKQAGLQYLVFRRLYSDLEREQARQKRIQYAHSDRVHQLKREKEVDRRIIEDEVDSFSTLSTEAAEEQERAAEWAELVALEERKQQLQKAKEMERYIEALRGRLKERLSQNHKIVPPLCSCGKSVWDTNPDTCANNCIFYRNPKGLARALSNLLIVLDA